MEETVKKYSTYLEVTKLMFKIKSMYMYEASETRKAKQVKSVMDLYKGKMQLEELLQVSIFSLLF